MSNLISIGSPYIHNTPGTFVNYLSRNFGANAGARKTETMKLNFEAIKSHLETEIKNMEKREKRFYELSKIEDWDKNDPLAWSDKFLARTGNVPTKSQKILDVWNSPDMISVLQGRLVGDGLKKRLKNYGIDDVSADFIAEAVDVQKALTEYLKVNLFRETVDGSIDLTTQKNLRKEILGETEKKMRRLRTGSSVIPKMISVLTTSEEKDIKSAQAYFKKKLEDAGIDLLEKNKRAKDAFNKAIKDIMNNNSNKHEVTGDVAEKGEAITLKLKFNTLYRDTNMNIKVKNIGKDLVERYAAGNVKSKIDMKITFDDKTTVQNETFYFQQKNTTLKDFSELLEIGQRNLILDSVFFRAQGDLSYNTFKEQIKELMKSRGTSNTDDSLAFIEYLLVNLCALNKGYVYGNEGSNAQKILKNKSANAKSTSIYVEGANKLLMNLMSQYCEIFFEDLILDAENSLKTTRYDFVIFNSRILIPMSYLYKGLLENLKDASKNIQKSIAYINITPSLKKGAFSKSEYNAMYEEKFANSNGGFDSSKDYVDTAMVQVGKKYGKNLLSSIDFTRIMPNINISKLIPYL